MANLADQRGYSDERWRTYKLADGLGGQAHHGQESSAIRFWQFEARKLARDKDGERILGAEGKPAYESTPLAGPRS